MIDPFVLLTPLLLLGVMALLRFVGCNEFWGLDETAVRPDRPEVDSINPTFKTQGEEAFILIVKGSSFSDHSANLSVVRWNGADRDTAFKSAAELWAQIPATDIVSAGTAEITVFTPGAGPSETSNPVNFTIVSSAVTVTFDNPPPPGNPGDPLTIPYKNLDFGNAAWIWVDPALGMGPANGININSGPNPGAADISFSNGPRLLLRLRVFPKRVANITISDKMSLNPPVSFVAQAADVNVVHFIDTGWTVLTPSFTVAADIGFDLIVDTIIYQGPP
jgi:hypothetical protein